MTGNWPPASSDPQVIFSVVTHSPIPELGQGSLGQLSQVQCIPKGRGEGGATSSPVTRLSQGLPGPCLASERKEPSPNRSKEAETPDLAPGPCHRSLPRAFQRGQRGVRTGRETGHCRHNTSFLCGTQARDSREGYSACLLANGLDGQTAQGLSEQWV